MTQVTTYKEITNQIRILIDKCSNTLYPTVIRDLSITDEEQERLEHAKTELAELLNKLINYYNWIGGHYINI